MLAGRPAAPTKDVPPAQDSSFHLLCLLDIRASNSCIVKTKCSCYRPDQESDFVHVSFHMLLTFEEGPIQVYLIGQAEIKASPTGDVAGHGPTRESARGYLLLKASEHSKSETSAYDGFPPKNVEG